MADGRCCCTFCCSLATAAHMPPGWQHTVLCESGTVRAQKLLVKKGKQERQDRANAARRNLRAAIPRHLREDWRKPRHCGAVRQGLAIGGALRRRGASVLLHA